MPTPCHVSGLDLSRYRDREMSSASLAELERHVEQCERCQLRLADSAVLSSLLSAQFIQSEHAPPAGFAASVMARLPQPRTLIASPRAWLPPRRQLTFGLIGIAAAASLAIVFAPSLRSQDDHLQETTENEAQIHSIEVSSPDRSAIVFESSEGNTIIWMVPSAEEDGGQSSLAEP